MGTSLQRVLDGVNGAVADGDASRTASVSVTVDSGETPTLRIETSGLESNPRVITVDLSTDDARALGAALFRATTEQE